MIWTVRQQLYSALWVVTDSQSKEDVNCAILRLQSTVKSTFDVLKDDKVDNLEIKLLKSTATNI